MFKNGLGFVYRSGETPLKDGWAAMDPVPNAVLGTFWVGTTSVASPIQEVVSFRDRKTEKRTFSASSISDILEANVGKTVFVTYNLEGYKRSRAKVLATPVRDRPGQNREPGDIVLLQLEGAGEFGVLALNKGQIQAVEMTEVPPMSTDVYTEVNRAKVHVKGSPAKAELTIAYLEKGFTWTPSYLVNISDEKQADITLEAVLSNDSEDLVDTDVSLVVGYPSFMYADVITPLSLQQNVGDFVARLASSSPATAGAMVLSNSAFGVYDSAWQPKGYTLRRDVGESNEDLILPSAEGHAEARDRAATPCLPPKPV